MTKSLTTSTVRVKNDSARSTLRDQHDVPFVHWGVLTLSVSPRWTPQNTDMKLVEVILWLNTAGSTPTVVELYYNKDVFCEMEIPADEERYSRVFPGEFPDVVPMAPRLFRRGIDTLQVGVATPGTGAQDLTAQCRLLSV